MVPHLTKVSHLSPTYSLTSTFPTGPMISLTSYFTYSSPTRLLALLVISWKFLAFSQWDFTLTVHSAQTALSTEHLFAHLIPSLTLFLFSGQETFKIATHFHIQALLIPSWFTVLHSIYNLLVMPYNSLHDFVLLFLVCCLIFLFFVGGQGESLGFVYLILCLAQVHKIVCLVCSRCSIKLCQIRAYLLDHNHAQTVKVDLW